MEREARRVLCALLLGLVPAVTLQVAQTGGAEAKNGGQVACVFDQTMLWSAAGTCRPHALSYPAGVSGPVKRAIYDSALTFGVPYAVLLRIAKCESGLNPRAAYAGHFGLFQFLPATFSNGAAQMRQLTGIPARSYWKPEDASYVAGFLFAVGHSTSWGCQ